MQQRGVTAQSAAISRISARYFRQLRERERGMFSILPEHTAAIYCAILVYRAAGTTSLFFRLCIFMKSLFRMTIHRDEQSSTMTLSLSLSLRVRRRENDKGVGVLSLSLFRYTLRFAAFIRVRSLCSDDCR